MLQPALHRRTIMTGVHSRTLTQACYGLPLGSRWSGSIKPCILPRHVGGIAAALCARPLAIASTIEWSVSGALAPAGVVHESLLPY